LLRRFAARNDEVSRTPRLFDSNDPSNNLSNNLLWIALFRRRRRLEFHDSVADNYLIGGGRNIA